MGLPGADLNLGQKIQENKNLKILNFEFCLSFKSVRGKPLHLTKQNPKNYFLYVKIFFEFCLRIG